MGDRLATIDMGRKVEGGSAVPLFEGVSWVPIGHNVACAKAYFHTKWHLDPSSRLATIHQRYKTDRETDNGPIA